VRFRYSTRTGVGEHSAPVGGCVQRRHERPVIILMIVLCLLAGGCTVGQPFGFVRTKPEAGTSRVRSRDGAEMVYVPAGEFLMGSTLIDSQWARGLCREYAGGPAISVCAASAFTDERPAHQVELCCFWIDRTEVTNVRYEECVQADVCSPPEKTGSFPRNSYFGDPTFSDYPVIWVR
jgi:formylglycine-generating enzyme required for sulfatase activity